MSVKKTRFSFIFVGVLICALLLKHILTNYIPVKVTNEAYDCSGNACSYTVVIKNESDVAHKGKLRVIGDLKKPLKMISMSGVYAGEKVEYFSLTPQQQLKIVGEVQFDDEVSMIRFVVIMEP